MRHLLEGQSMELDAFQCKMGRINKLANQHGLVAEAIEKALAGEETTDLTTRSVTRSISSDKPWTMQRQRQRPARP